MKNILKLALLTATAFSVIAPTSYAKDLGNGPWAKERFQLRGRLVSVAADGDGRVSQNGLQTDVEHSPTIEADITYFFSQNVAAELIAATSRHEIYAGASNLGEAWILPPTVTLQYHFTPDNKFSPYIGAGLNYSLFYGEKDGNGFDNLDVDGGVGYALQAGMDYWLNDNWGVNLDVKYINLDIDVTVESGGTTLNADNVDLDPFILGRESPTVSSLFPHKKTRLSQAGFFNFVL